jgi:ABC-type multidrug transport system ATPase subunit
MTFLRTALNAQRKARGEEEVSAGDFLKLVRAKAKDLKIDADMLKRPVNVGFSGGEKKRNEILQMALLEPKMCILDETDSGLDVDAMKLVAEGVNALRDAGRGFLVITHYQRLLDHIQPDVVHIMSDGRIVKTGGPELALEVERTAMPTSSRRWRDGAGPSKAGPDRARLADLSSPEGEAAWATDARKAAVARVRAEGLPTRRDEYWKYTDPASLTQAPAPRAALFDPPAKRRFSTGSTG